MKGLVDLLESLTLKPYLLKFALEPFDLIHEALKVTLQDQDTQVAVLHFVLSALDLKLFISQRSLGQE
jgi:hypothetical protein